MCCVPLLFAFLTVSTAPQSNPVAAPFAGGALFVWSEGGSMRAGVFRGAPIAHSTPLPGQRCAIAPAGEVALALCWDASGLGPFTTTLLDRNADAIADGPAIVDDHSASVASNGKCFVIATVDALAQVTLQTWDLDLHTVLAARTVFRSPTRVDAQVISNGDGFLLIVQETLASTGPTVGTPISVFPLDAGGNVLSDKTIVSTQDSGFGSVMAASDGRDYVLRWRGFDSYLHARRISAGGLLLGHEGAVHEWGYGTAFAWDGKNYDDVLLNIDQSFAIVQFNRDLSSAAGITMQLPRNAPLAAVTFGDGIAVASFVESRIFIDEITPRPRGRTAGH